jgi:hypothetical protein
MKHMASRVKEIRSLVQAAATGSQVDQLKALRNRLAAAIEDEKTRPREMAELSRLMLDVMKEITRYE